MRVTSYQGQLSFIRLWRDGCTSEMEDDIVATVWLVDWFLDLCD